MTGSIGGRDLIVFDRLLLMFHTWKLHEQFEKLETLQADLI